MKLTWVYDEARRYYTCENPKYRIAKYTQCFYAVIFSGKKALLAATYTPFNTFEEAEDFINEDFGCV